MSYVKYLVMIFFPTLVWGLAPVDSLILGDLSDEYREEKNDPLNYLFSQTWNQLDENEDNDLLYFLNYRGFIEEGRNLEQYCKKKPHVIYPSPWKEAQAVRSMIASMQYLGLDISIRAIANYAKHFEFTPEEYKNLADGLVKNYCSQNISIISLKELRKNMELKFSSKGEYKLPGVDGNKYFSEILQRINSKDGSRRNEFYYTLDLFKSLCSWGNDVDNTRLLVPLLRNPQLVAFVIRQMSGVKLSSSRSGEVKLQPSAETVKVACENLICRKRDDRRFKEVFPRAIGSTSLEQDLKGLYCSHLRDADYLYKGQVPKIKKMINDKSFEDEIFVAAQFLALLTGVPDFFIGAEKYSDFKKILRSSLDNTFNDWALERAEIVSRDIFYEESLSIEKVERRLYFKDYRDRFKVIFDVNVGEFDRNSQIAGKVSLKFHVHLPHSYLAWVRDKWINWDPRNKDERKIIIDNFKKYITDDVQKARDKFIVPPWKGDLERLIAVELLAQLNLYKGEAFDNIRKELVEIPVVLNFSPFALKYIKYKKDVQRNTEIARRNYR